MDIMENQIRERAHWLWKQAGSPEGRDLEFWFEAQQSFLADGAVSRADELHKHETPLPLSSLAFTNQS